jgi:ankyrin repeat protein
LIQQDFTFLAVEDESNCYGWTALMIAAMVGNASAVKILIDRWVDLDAINDFEDSALIYAAADGHEDVVRLLLSAGANPHTENYQECTARYFACKYGHWETAKIIEEYEKEFRTRLSSKHSRRTHGH